MGTAELPAGASLPRKESASPEGVTADVDAPPNAAGCALADKNSDKLGLRWEADAGRISMGDFNGAQRCDAGTMVAPPGVT